MNEIYLLPYLQKKANRSNLNGFKKKKFLLSKVFPNKDMFFFNDAKTGIRYLMEKYKLERNDEVCIITTTDSSFVSSCVTSTIFNYCKVSRIITENTKMIYVIHEFGFPYKKVNNIIKIGKKKGIPVVEDVAHSLNSFYHNKRLGLFGDYALYSFPKILPVQRGGLLIGDNLSEKNIWFDFDISKEIENYISKYLPYIESFSQKRRENYYYFRNIFKEFTEIFEINNNINPFVFGFETDRYQKIYDNLHRKKNGFELHTCYVKDWVVLPINQFITEEQLEYMGNKIISLIKEVI